MRRFLRHNGLSLGFGLIFLLALGFQSLAGWQEFNNEEVAHAELTHERPETISYGRYLLIVMFAIFLGSWFAHSVTGWTEFNADQVAHEQQKLSWVAYLGSSDFWQTTLQNWQSEFLAVGSMAILSVYLRQRGSPESKPVGIPHEATGVEG